MARFQCQGTKRYGTFSMLPYQLVPYFQYTLESMIAAILLWREFWKDLEEPGTAYRVEQELPCDATVTSWHLCCWALLFKGWLEAAHSELADRYDFSAVRFHTRLPAILDEIFDYFESLSRGPPGRGEAVVSLVREHGAMTGRFLLGVPSQGR